MGSELLTSGGNHGWRWESAPGQVGWQRLPVPERDMVEVKGVGVGASASGSVVLVSFAMAAAAGAAFY